MSRLVIRLVLLMLSPCAWAFYSDAPSLIGVSAINIERVMPQYQLNPQPNIDQVMAAIAELKRQGVMVTLADAKLSIWMQQSVLWSSERQQWRGDGAVQAAANLIQAFPRHLSVQMACLPAEEADGLSDHDEALCQRVLRVLDGAGMQRTMVMEMPGQKLVPEIERRQPIVVLQMRLQGEKEG